MYRNFLVSDYDNSNAILFNDVVAPGRISSFKIEQKIIELKTKNAAGVGGFVNGNSEISRFRTRYWVVFYSNDFTSTTDDSGNVYLKRLGYGYGFILEVSNIETKLNLNFSIIAASAALSLARANYEIKVIGTVDPALITAFPGVSGPFDNSIYKQLKVFAENAKSTFTTTPPTNLYQIEQLTTVVKSSNSSDYKSIYFATKAVSEGKNLNETVVGLRNSSIAPFINENIVKFIYSYFGLDNAYVAPTSAERMNAQSWLGGTYNKVTEFTSSNDSWVAIEPALLDGKFVVLSNFGEAEKYAPHPIPENWASQPKVTEGFYSEVSADFSSNLKLASVVDISAEYNTINIIRDISFYLDTAANPPASTKVKETRYGVAIRLVLRISNIEFGTKINYATIGAASELGHATVEYEISGLGISDPGIISSFPPPQDFNEDTLNEINKAFNDIKSRFAQLNPADMKPQPLMIKVGEPEKIDNTLNAQSYVFCMTKIADRLSEKIAIKDARTTQIKPEFIKKVYREEYGLLNEDERPTREQKFKAQKWLDMEY